MKIIGLLGGMSWESTANYYRAINEGIKARLGGLHSAKICLFSVDFAEIEACQHRGEWDKAAQILSAAAKSVEAGGADFLLICTNTMHKLAEPIQGAIGIPLLHIADATAKQLQQRGINKVGLLGTRFTMEQDFYKGRLQDNYGIEVLVPDEHQRNLVHQVIYEELCLGKVEAASKDAYLHIIQDLQKRGAQGVILGCTEIAMLVKQEDTPVALFDTTAIHAQAAVEMALA
ncbi:aspartate/glutamate racemase family protein [Aliiglaciecola sp. CAU 1673]|uniref:aspartate/glutamate racemase family protein n=1 Tax=Aliiglaciecola sp. CAU 1673 TaxID=3032595 RepID=UPI0023D99733|nr:aspartate/glutamate racemase family protein [Aliiglaciecola sp. CAU 1673]MDF2179779.1 aspartate/glutamate racemase family protein [Aliiglaciecola sp. CAU 1673]